MTLLCVPIFVQSPEQARRDALLAAEAGADILELRIDDLDQPLALPGMPLPCILTCRPEYEGGRSTLADSQRIELLNRMGGEARYVDVELKALAAVAIPGNRLIVSSHNFTGRPARLSNLILELNQSPGAINKIVWMARTIRDNLEAFEILQHRQKPTIALCMGEAGLISRVLAKKFGAFLTFASLRDESATAPGQVTIHDMKRLYRWDAINPATKVYGVVASPVMHSMSPAIHNVGFEAVGHDGVYLPLLVNPGYESFKAFMESFLAFEPLQLSGLSITLPHKENALRYLKEKGAQVEELADRIGAVNTIVIEPPSSIEGSEQGRGTGRRPVVSDFNHGLAARAMSDPSIANRNSQIANLHGFNTDYAAILDTISSALNINRDQLSAKRIAVLGAGGTGRTAVAALAHCGATVVIYNRTREKADALAAEFNGKAGKVVAAPMEKLCDSCCEIYINTTTLGLHPNIDASPFNPSPPKLTGESLVFDTIYNPIETKLLKQAKASSAKTVGGIEMFIRQAAGQFEAWTGRPAPLDLFRKVIESRLS